MLWRRKGAGLWRGGWAPATLDLVTEAELEDVLSRPGEADVAAMRALEGDILVLGVSGKMGPSLAKLARRAADAAGGGRRGKGAWRIIGASRFSSPAARADLEAHGIETIAVDLLDRAAITSLPECRNVVYMVGQKFGTSGDSALTWATNVHAAGLAAERFAKSRIVAFSTGNVYPLTPVTGSGPIETSPTGPVGEYAQSALGRERILEFWSRRNATPMAILRLNYAIEPRYGVLRDIADRVWSGEPVDLAMGFVNVIAQRDANSIALRMFAHCTVPPSVLNLTGPDLLSVRALAERFGQMLGKPVRFAGAERDTALLSNASACRQRFGPLDTPLDAMMSGVADWVREGGRSLGKPTHFAERGGEF